MHDESARLTRQARGQIRHERVSMMIAEGVIRQSGPWSRCAGAVRKGRWEEQERGRRREGGRLVKSKAMPSLRHDCATGQTADNAGNAGNPASSALCLP